MDVIVEVIVVSQGGSVVLTQGEVPGAPLGSDESPEGIARDLLRRVTGITGGWAHLTQAGFFKRADESFGRVVFCHLCPEEFPLERENARWIPHAELAEPVWRRISQALRIAEPSAHHL